MTSTQGSVSPWPRVVEQIRIGSESAVEDMYRSLRSIHFLFKRDIGLDRADDAYHNLIIVLVGAIKSGALRQAEALPAYAMTIARRMVSEDRRRVIRARQTPDLEDLVLIAPAQSPEQLAARSERAETVRRIFTTLPPLGQEILVRFYVNGESEEEIREAMGISHNRFRVIKSRTKLRYAELVQRSVNINSDPARKPVLFASQVSRQAVA